MTLCRACNRQTNPYGEYTPRGVINRCGHEDCRRPIDGGLLPAAANVGFSARSSFPELANAAPAPAPALQEVPPESKPAPRKPKLALVKPAEAPQEARALDAILPELRARLSVVKSTLADMAALQREEAVLERMLAAVEDPAN